MSNSKALSIVDWALMISCRVKHTVVTANVPPITIKIEGKSINAEKLPPSAIAMAAMGDPNASIPTPQPVHYRPMFGAFGGAGV